MAKSKVTQRWQESNPFRFLSDFSDRRTKAWDLKGRLSRVKGGSIGWDERCGGHDQELPRLPRSIHSGKRWI